MKKTFLVLSLSAMLWGMTCSSARAVVLMDDDIDLSFSFSNNFNNGPWVNPDRKTIKSDAMAYSGTYSLEEIHPERLNRWGGQNLRFQERLDGTAGDASASDRNLSQFDVLNGGTGQLELSWWYKILEPVDLNSDGTPENDTSEDVLPVQSVSLDFFDEDHVREGENVFKPTIVRLTSEGTYNMIADGEWHQASVILDVIEPSVRAGLNHGPIYNDPNILTTLSFTTNIAQVQSQQFPPNPSDFYGAPSHFFIDLVEMNAVIPEPATLSLLGLGLLMLPRRRRGRR